MKVAALALGAVLFPMSALAQNACAPFDLTSLDGRVVASVDHGEQGHSIDDRRVGERIIGDANGEPIGEVRWQITVLDPDPGDKPTHSLLRMFFFFDEGTLFAEGVHQPQGDLHATDKVSANMTELVVLGGTGVFRHARGVIDMLPAADGNPETLNYAVDVTCD